MYKVYVGIKLDGDDIKGHKIRRYVVYVENLTEEILLEKALEIYKKNNQDNENTKAELYDYKILKKNAFLNKNWHKYKKIKVYVENNKVIKCMYKRKIYYPYLYNQILDTEEKISNTISLNAFRKLFDKKRIILKDKNNNTLKDIKF